MIQLLFSLLSAEVGVVLILLYKTPLRNLGIAGLDRLKRGRGPLVVKTVAGTFLIVLCSSLYSMAKIGDRTTEIGSLNPTDQVLMARHLLEASLMGYSLFLALIIDRLHHYVRELRAARKSVEVVMKQNRVLEEAKSGGSEEVKARDKEIASLNERIKAAEANAIALGKQSEGLLLEYDRLLEDNQNLRNQLMSIDSRLSHSEGKKNT